MFHVKQIRSLIVVGGGHAGCEAALAAARMGVPTTLITLSAGKTAEMSCNPSIGGVGKGQLVKEIDALGGEMGKNADYTAIQFKRLNTRKGGAVQSSRCQSDKKKYALRMQLIIASQPQLKVLEAEVKSLLTENGRITGLAVKLASGVVETLSAHAIVITAGTFMQAVMHCGAELSAGGRFGEGSSVGLSGSLRELGFTISRLKTGTPPRLLRESIDFSKMETQWGDENPRKFSFSPTEIVLPQVPCHLTYSNERTHDVIRENLSRSPLYSGQIKGVGPRYCPSIEDKVVKFPDKNRHPLFFEPEALDSNWIYPNGISTSLPGDVQEAFLQTIPGCESVKLARYGYAVEYDCIDPRQLSPSLEAKHLPGLFLGGQVNGTSGYEEAAIQGLHAGICAALSCQDKAPLHLSRSEAYLGVLVDDLTRLGVTEPYRMFTSRAEYRLSMREDNADLRLRPYGRALGLVNDADYEAYEKRQATIEKFKAFLPKKFVKPTAAIREIFKRLGTAPMDQAQNLSQLLKRPELGLRDVLALWPGDTPAPLDACTEETLEIEVKYEGYIQMQLEEIARLNKMGDLSIPGIFNYAEVAGLSRELKEKLAAKRPGTLADAAEISGVTPAALTALLFHLRQKGDSPAKAIV